VARQSFQAAFGSVATGFSVLLLLQAAFRGRFLSEAIQSRLPKLTGACFWIAWFGHEGSACRSSLEQQDRLKAWITETGLIALLHRLGMERRKPQAIPSLPNCLRVDHPPAHSCARSRGESVSPESLRRSAAPPRNPIHLLLRVS